MSFMGELADIGVSDLLYLIAVRCQTGKLTVNTNNEDVSLYFDHGQLVLVKSSNPTLRLGKTLVRMGFLSNEQLREALARQERDVISQALGGLLIKYQYITEPQLSMGVEEQCVEILSRVIVGDSGSFVYSPDASLPARTEIISLHADRIIIEAIRRSDELGKLREQLPDMNSILELTANVDAISGTLSDDELVVATELQHASDTIKELSYRLAMDQLALWKAIKGLHDRNIVAVQNTTVVRATTAELELAVR
jgi:Domain of unknown function (DUF4388)